ncbi:hypothetical protein SprV_0200568700 [Sparganum proliferum]
MADDIASFQKQTASSSSQSQSTLSTLHVQSAHSARSNTAATYWYYTTFGARARRCIFPYSFTSKQTKQVKRISPKVGAANLPGSSNPAYTFYVRDTLSGRRFLAQLSAIPPTAADRRCPNPTFFLQAVSIPPIATFGTCSFSLDIDRRRPFP